MSKFCYLFTAQETKRVQTPAARPVQHGGVKSSPKLCLTESCQCGGVKGPGWKESPIQMTYERSAMEACLLGLERHGF